MSDIGARFDGKTLRDFNECVSEETFSNVFIV